MQKYLNIKATLFKIYYANYHAEDILNEVFVYDKQLVEKIQEYTIIRGVSHRTKNNYLRKEKEIIEYKKMRQVTTKGLRYFLLKYLREEKQVGERSIKLLQQCNKIHI